MKNKSNISCDFQFGIKLIIMLQKTAAVYDLKGVRVGEMKLPKVFSSPVRADLIKRAVLSMQANRRQPYGASILSGLQTSAHYHGVKDTKYSMKNKEMARGPRVHESAPGQTYRMRRVPQAVGGREAHPPRVEKILIQKINEKEKRIAVQSAIAASAVKELVAKKGHKFENELPIIVSSGIESVSKVKDIEKVLAALKLESEMERAKMKNIRAGKGKARGRKYRKRKSLLIVAEGSMLKRILKSMPGIDVSSASQLNAELLAPGCQPGRLVVWSENSIKKLEEKYG